MQWWQWFIHYVTKVTADYCLRTLITARIEEVNHSSWHLPLKFITAFDLLCCEHLSLLIRWYVSVQPPLILFDPFQVSAHIYDHHPPASITACTTSPLYHLLK